MHALTHSVPLTLKQATANPHLHRRLLDTHWQVWVSLLWGHCSFLLGPGVHKVLFVSSKSLFPQSCVSSVIKSHWPPKSNYLGVVSPFARSQVGKSVVGSGSFLTVQEFLWDHCSAICGLSAQQLYGGVNGDLLQEDLCHRLCDPELCPEIPCPCGRTLQSCTSAGDSNRVLVQSLWGLWVLVCTRFCLSPLSVSSGYGV